MEQTMLSIYAKITTRDGSFSERIERAFLEACEAANAAGIPVHPGWQKNPHNVATCRNEAVAEFLFKPEYSHLLFVDDDVTIPRDAVIRLAALAELPGHDVVCGCYPSVKYYEPDIPTPYVVVLPLGGSKNADWMTQYPRGVVEVEAAGGGCMMISRAVLKTIGHPWFRCLETYRPDEGRIEIVTDDVDFCQRARGAGFRIWADGNIRCGHTKPIDVAALICPEPRYPNDFDELECR